MKKLIIAMILVANFCYSQEKIPFVDYNDIVAQVRKENQPEKILEIIGKINKNDSAYYALLTSKSYYLLQVK